MNRRELVLAIAAHTDQDRKTVEQIVAGLTDVITAVVSKGEPVAISGFAKFTKVERAARMGRNPATGEAIKIKASKKARITPLKGFKDAVLTPSQAPKLAKGVWPAAPAAAAKPAARTTKAAAAAKPAARATKAAAAKPAARTTRAAAAKPAARTTKAAAAKPAARTTRAAAAAKPATRKPATRAAAAKPAARTTRAAAAKPAARKATTTRATTTRRKAGAR